MEPTVDVILQAASAAPSSEAWRELGERLFEAAAEPSTIARWLPELEMRLHDWPDELRTAHLVAGEADHLQGRVGWDTEIYGEAAGPWLALIRTLVASPDEILACADQSMWVRHAFPVVRRWEVKRARDLAPVADAATRLPALRTLSFRPIALDGPAHLRSWPVLFDGRGLEYLERLDLAGLRLSARTVAALVEGRLARSLIRLDLTDCDLGDEGAVALAAWPRPSHLAALALGDDRIGPRGLSAIARGRLLDGLADLVLAGNELDTDGLSALVASPLTASLRSFDASGAGLGDEMLAPLTASVHIIDLAALRLADNALTDDAVDLLLDSRFAPALVELDLRRNQLTAAAAERFTRRPRPPHLQRLDLAGNRLSPTALAAIARWLDGGSGFAPIDTTRSR